MTTDRPGGSILFLTFCDKTVFIKLQDVFPECFLYREEMPRAEPLMCLSSTCPGNHACMETLAKRVFVLFREVMPYAHLIVLYYRRRNTNSLGAGLFWSDMREPRDITMNPFAWEMIKARGLVYEFHPGPNFFLTGQAPPPENVNSTSLDPPSRIV